MLKRKFSVLGYLASKSSKPKSKNDDLKGILMYITNNRTTLSSLLRPPSEKCEEQVVELLNKGLPDVNKQVKAVETHYDVLVGSLKDIIHKDMRAKSFEERLRDCGRNSHALLRLLWERILYHREGLAPNMMCRIVLNPHFTVAHANEMLAAIDSCPKYRRDYALILCYKTRRKDVYNSWKSEWEENYMGMSSIAQKLFWRLTAFLSGMDDVNRCLSQIPIEKSQEFVVKLHELLSENSYKLPESLMECPLTHAQKIFCQAVRMLSTHSSDRDSEPYRWCGELVKISVSNKLARAKGATTAFNSALFEKPEFSLLQYTALQSLQQLLTNIVERTSANPELNRDALELLQQLQSQIDDTQQQVLLSI
ncbi:HHL283Cp [Eremothecium sinecaudum]|uniref:HHL283Cp n=1 Tax=Eremothecium sinecaudum TaxID=45286 RepID=A0A120K2S9_9SACH|nr:HHL283Cp [Eremothecium sinecaudum]AMD22487.1 HHL283Cp [Eremothecium sinecaudum]